MGVELVKGYEDARASAVPPVGFKPLPNIFLNPRGCVLSSVSEVVLEYGFITFFTGHVKVAAGLTSFGNVSHFPVSTSIDSGYTCPTLEMP